MLSLRMRRPGLIIALVLAVLLTAQPLLHNHSLTEKVATPCSVCAFGADRTAAAPSVSAPLHNTHAFPSLAETSTFVPVTRTSSPRAPPAAA